MKQMWVTLILPMVFCLPTSASPNSDYIPECTNVPDSSVTVESKEADSYDTTPFRLTIAISVC